MISGRIHLSYLNTIQWLPPRNETPSSFQLLKNGALYCINNRNRMIMLILNYWNFKSGNFNLTNLQHTCFDFIRRSFIVFHFESVAFFCGSRFHDYHSLKNIGHKQNLICWKELICIRKFKGQISHFFIMIKVKNE